MVLFDLIYSFILILFSPVLLLKYATDRSFRSYWKARCLKEIDTSEPPTGERIWLHAASVGEVNLAMKVIHYFEKKGAAIEFVLTTNTLSAFEMAKHRGAQHIYLAPLDFSRLVKKFIQLTGVRHLILIETELWPNMISLMQERGTISVINGRLSDKHFKTYRRFRFLFKSAVQRLSLILAGDPISAERFIKLGAQPHNVQFVGNLKFELPASPNESLIEELIETYAINPNERVFVMGSIQPAEVEPLIKGIRKAQDRIGHLRLIMVPRHTDKKEQFKAELKKAGIPYYFSSDGPYLPKHKEENRVIVIDQVGVLLAFYKIADLIFVGGSLCNRGGQNMLEAVALKKPVFIGPFATNFQQEVNILNQGKGIRIIKSPAEISEFIAKCLSNKKLSASYAINGYRTLMENSGGFTRTVLELESLLRLKK